jgi:hypothetical protein
MQGMHGRSFWHRIASGLSPKSRDRQSLDNRALDNRALDNRALDNRALDNRALDNRALDNRALDNRDGGLRTPRLSRVRPRLDGR